MSTFCCRVMSWSILRPPRYHLQAPCKSVLIVSRSSSNEASSRPFYAPSRQDVPKPSTNFLTPYTYCILILVSVYPYNTNIIFMFVYHLRENIVFVVLFLLYIIIYHNNGDARAQQTRWGTDFFVFLVLFIRFFVLFVCV